MYGLPLLNVACTPLKAAHLHPQHGIHFCHQSCQAPGEEACGIRVAMEDCELHFMGPGWLLRVGIEWYLFLFKQELEQTTNNLFYPISLKQLTQSEIH